MPFSVTNPFGKFKTQPNEKNLPNLEILGVYSLFLLTYWDILYDPFTDHTLLYFTTTIPHKGSPVLPNPTALPNPHGSLTMQISHISVVCIAFRQQKKSNLTAQNRRIKKPKSEESCGPKIKIQILVAAKTKEQKPRESKQE